MNREVMQDYVKASVKLHTVYNIKSWLGVQILAWGGPVTLNPTSQRSACVLPYSVGVAH